MEIMISWFWLVKLLVFSAFIFSGYKLYLSKFKSKFWMVMVFVGLVMLIINPIKMKSGTNMQSQIEYSIKNNHSSELPPKVQDKTWENSNKAVKGISEKDLK